MSQSLPFLQQCAPPFFYIVLLFLAFPSQWLFSVTSPGSLTKDEAWKFNFLVVCTAITYARTWLTDPGRIPLNWAPAVGSKDDNRTRWCRRCESFKPPRAHHCKTCGRYVGCFQISTYITSARLPTPSSTATHSSLTDVFQRWIIIVLGSVSLGHFR